MTGRPFSFNLQQIRSLGDHYRRVIELCETANATGAQLRPQITPRSVGVLFSFAANSLVDDLPSWAPLKAQRLPARLAALRDAEFRHTLIDEGAHKTPEMYDSMFVMRGDEAARYDYGAGDSLGALARRQGVSVIQAYLDEMLRSNGQTIINWPVMNQDESAIAEQIIAPCTIMGLADAGAHATQIMDASQPTYLLSHWVRDKELLTLEAGVKALTSDTAGFVGYAGRGTVEVGSFADVNVLDWHALSLPVPEIAHDFPGEAPRFVQRANGVEHTLINGRLFMVNGEHTGATPGRLLRSTSE